MENGTLTDKSLDFAIKIVNLCNNLCTHNVLIAQLIKSGTSIGANIREAQYAESKADFVHKLQISLKECNETDYWLEVLYASKILTEIQYTPLINECRKIKAMLSSAILKTKTKN